MCYFVPSVFIRAYPRNPRFESSFFAFLKLKNLRGTTLQIGELQLTIGTEG